MIGDKMNFNKLNLEEKFGQMILLGLDVYDVNDEIIDIIKHYKIGGVVLYRKNYISIETMCNLVNKLKKANEKNPIPLFIAIDQENGRVNRFPKDLIRIYSAKKQAKTENMKIINTVNKLTAYVLENVGVNMNFAPVLDVNNKKNKTLGNRSYGKNAEDVIKYGLPFMHELQNSKIISVIKHFPAIGANNRDNMLFLPHIDINDLNENMKVFETAIKQDADALLVGHLKVSGYGLKPASLNKKIIHELLIKKYKFKGLIISDDLRMSALKKGLPKKVKNCVEAGSNAFILKYRKGDSKNRLKKLLELVRCCEIDPIMINESAKKIVQIKKKYEIKDSVLDVNLDIKLINKKINQINDIIEKSIGSML